MIQALETGKEFKTQVYISSWDMKRAFDALPKPLLVFSWIRMGVPADSELAEYLVAMDWGGHSLVRSPLAMSTVVDEGFEKAIEDDLTFDAVRGTA